MQCPNCGNTDLSLKFKWCPDCGSSLLCASNVTTTKQGIAQTTTRQGEADNNIDQGADNTQIQGKHQKQEAQQQEKQQSLTSQAPGTRLKSNTDQDSAIAGHEKTPAEERTESLPVDQCPEVASSDTSPQGPEEEAVVTEGANAANESFQIEQTTTGIPIKDPTTLLDTDDGATPHFLQDQASPIAKEGQENANKVSNNTMTSSSSAQEIREPAALEDGSPYNFPDPSEVHHKDKAAYYKTPAKPSDNSPSTPTNQHERVDDNVRKGRNVSENNKGDSCDSLTIHIPSGGTGTVSQQKLQEEQDLSDSVSKKKDESKAFPQIDAKEQQQQQQQQQQEIAGEGRTRMMTRKGDMQSSITQPPPSLQQVTSEAGVTVVFHVLLASKFNMTEERFFIRAHGADLGDFQQNCVDMTAVRKEKSNDEYKLTLFRGQFTLSLDRAKKGTSYKYLVVKNGKVYWEDLSEFSTSGIVNRVLKIPDKSIKPGVTWNQFDGLAYVYGNQGIFSRVKDYFLRDKTAEYRTSRALACFLPKWKGFVINEATEEMDATEALLRLQNVVECLSNVWTEENGHKKSNNVDVQKALMELLKQKISANIAALAACKVGSSLHVSAVVSSLAIIVLVKKCDIELQRKELISLLSCLALEADLTEKRCSAFEAVLAEFDTDFRKFAANAIEHLCNQLMKQVWTSNPEWLLAIPLLHFLREDSKPFEEPDILGWPQSPAWWGSQNLCIKEFQRSHKQDFSAVCSNLASAFEVDRLLKRTFLHAIPVWQLHGIVSPRMFHLSDLYVALVTFFPLKEMSKEKMASIEKFVKDMVYMLETAKETNRYQTEITEFTVSASLKLAETFIENLTLPNGIVLICHAIKLLFLSVQIWRNAAVDNHSDKDDKSQRTRTMKEDVTRQLLEKLGSKLNRVLNFQMIWELEVWSMLLRVCDELEEVQGYRTHLTEQFISQAKRMRDTDLVGIFCEVNLDVYDKDIGESLTKLAFEAVEKIINSRHGEDADRVFQSLYDGSCRRNGKRTAKYGELLSMLLTKSWPKGTEVPSALGFDPVTVEFLLSWNPMTPYLKFFGDESKRGSILTSEGQATLSMAKSVLSALVERLSNSSVTVQVLEALQKHKQRFMELLEAISMFSNKENEVQMREEGEQHLAERIEEIQAFQTVKKKVMTFIDMCDLISPVNITSIKEKALQDVSFHQIHHLCERKDDKEIDVFFFVLPPLIAEVLSPLYNVQESSTFQDFWAQCGKKAQATRKKDESSKRELSISSVVDDVWKPAYKMWSQLVASVWDGSLTLGDVDKFFESYLNRNEDLVRELVCIFKWDRSQTSINTRNVKAMAETRATQIQRYQKLRQYASKADTIWEFKEAMEFSGDFKIIADLRNQFSTEFRQNTLTSIGNRFTKACRALDRLDEDQVQCFKAVVDSKRLIEWLRTTMTSIQELKVLVDLALISAGESDMETDRISILHTSCLGFAPLIFDLKESQAHKVNFDQLMKACIPVWKAVETDKTLPKKLYDTSRHLEWLKTVKESHGSVATTSLAQCKAINSSGVYVVGWSESPSTQGRAQLSLDDVVTLFVPLKDEEQDFQSKSYSLNELKDLQSKLMLIAGKAGKGKEEVDKFVKNLEGVMRLAKACIKLSESGFVHRMYWSQEFHCSKDQREGESIAKDLAAESITMENCYKNWKVKVSNAREEYQELNFFTTQQLMLLRKEIATACRSSDLHVKNSQVFILLESVRPNLEAEHLKSAIQRAFKDKDILDQTRRTGNFPSFPSFSLNGHQVEFDTRKSLFKNNNYVDNSPSTIGSTSQVLNASIKNLKIRRFLDAAENKGYSEQVALSALASLGVDAGEDELLLWCSEEAYDADLEYLYEKAISNPIIAKEIDVQKTEVKEFSATINESEKSLDLHSKLSQSSPDQVGSTDDENEAKISEYLTLAQLGIILRELAVKGKGKKPRIFPAVLKRGRPNLILVPKGDVLATALALFMHDKQQSLPSHEEVLICTPETTVEEIELLWRRATGDSEGRFYCLVHADQLEFSVSKEAVQILNVVTQGLAGKSGQHFGLVVICSSENEDRANIVAALDQYRVAAPPCPSLSDLQSYLKMQFRIPSSQEGEITWIAAGSLDPENLCVRVVSSNRGGSGKTLFVRRLTDQLPNLVNNNMVISRGSDISLHVTVPLHGNTTDSSMLVDSLLPHAVSGNVPLSRVFHLDVSPSMKYGLDTLLFNLLVLGSPCDKMGRVWRRRMTDLYVIEITTAAALHTGFSREDEAERQERQSGRSTKRPFYDLLPTIMCTNPTAVLSRLASKQGPNDFDPLFDIKEFQSEPFQRAYQYLKLLQEGKHMDNFKFVPDKIDDDQNTCLALFLRNSGIPDPSWSEIRHFVSFLNSQLRDCEESIFCNMELMRSILTGRNVRNLEGFRSFVVRFMIQMSRDFATPSLTEEATVVSKEDNAELERREIEQYELRRSWENSPHPYLFFNQDHNTMTFLGFFINSAGDLIDPHTNKALVKFLMSKQLREGLQAQGVDFTTKARNLKKMEMIGKLCSVMGVKPTHDPDRAYELTPDNVKKILAIHMRFRCNIPVIVMGETGCGKTRLIRYMCGLQAGPKKEKGPKRPRNMLLVKVHGGTTYGDIEQKVQQAEEMARKNQDKNIDTVLFFDEANTTEALSMIKEVMVDRRIRGRPIGESLERLQFIAACNPYRRHTDDMIHKLESAGLGYHVKTEQSQDRLGHTPLRHLVYRVHALPGSMRPLIWDFGQLNNDVESLYTEKIVSRYILHERQLPGGRPTVQGVAAVLAASQKYMRDQSDECSFVSLRDVERAMQAMVWFYKHLHILGKLMKAVITEQRREEGEEVDNFKEQEPIDPLTRALVLAIGVCYHAKLQERRDDYRKVVAQSFKAPCLLPGGQKQILREITSCQRAVLNELELGPNIARNTALSENLFMMVVCIELRIPLFVVGKPGSSKSLAKTVVADNMTGDVSRSELFKSFKQVHMVSYQCSPLSTPEGILATFRQCSKLQEGKNSDRFVSVVVLDEIGLAEDSPRMPLKTLHPLLEDGVTSADDVIETDEKPQRVAFIGISNWALDPAKMNRGIMLSRTAPDVAELVDTALGICSMDKQVKHLFQAVIPPLAAGYAELYKEQKNFATLRKCGKKEFFGLRDFYSLIKMVYAIAAKSRQRPRWNQLELAIRRNFGGLVEREPVKIFKRYFPDSDEGEEAKSSTTIRLIQASLGREDVADQPIGSENRYLLILTENYAALRIIQQHLSKTSDDAVVIFGSSFPNDQEYTQICRNINRIKVCMETGRTVILLNLESLYESLYDALNQYYVYFGDQKYVDLGLGTHRFKCRVHDDFKLIVIAEKEVVYNTFPIPLINRLEKHFLVTSTSLTTNQMDLVEKLRIWADDFAKVTGPRKRCRDFSIGDAFVGYHEDTIPSIVMQVCNELEEVDAPSDEPNDPWENKVVRRCKNMLLGMTAPDAIARLPASSRQETWKIYFRDQQHSSLAAFMSHVLTNDFHRYRQRQKGLFVQITTHSRLLSNNDLTDFCYQTGFRRSAVNFLILHQFQTEQNFRSSIRSFFEYLGGRRPGILVVQCDSGDDNFNLIAGARHILMEERKNAPELLNLPTIEAVHIALVVQLPRIAGGCRNFVGFQGGEWISSHIDELRPPGRENPSVKDLIDRPISELFGSQRQLDKKDGAQTLAVNLLRNCVQAAVCRVDDVVGSSKRSTQRIEILLDLLSEAPEGLKDERTFASVLTQRTYHLLKEQERTALDACEWLHSEAMSGRGVQECGTFRKALSKRICSTVVPILAEIIAFADRDSNLDLIKSNNTWFSTLWLKILENPNLFKLSYRNMISPVANSVRERVQVTGSGAGGHSFQCIFPFSFIVKQHMEQMLKYALSLAAQSSAQTVVESLRNCINNSEMGPILCELRHNYLAALQYLNDFVHMVYKTSSTYPSEHQLVCEAILSSARELGVGEDEDGEEKIDIVLVHVAHIRVQSRLRCFSKLVQAQPDVVPKLKEIFRGRNSEMLLDVVALQVCLEELNGSEDVFLGPDSRRIWCDKVLSIRPVVQDMMRKERFGAVAEMCSNYGEKTEMLLDRCRSIWQRAGAVRLFVEHITLFSDDDDRVDSENLARLWETLGDETDFSSLKSLQTIEKFLINYIEDTKHSFRADELRSRCNAFFMELVSLFCFDQSSKDLKEDALSLLMGYVFGRQSTQTKDFSPFPDYGIDATPVVRSFLLQQLLRSSTKLVKEHLEVFLKEAQSLKSETHHTKEVCFLCIQCMEDTLLSQYQAKVVDSKFTVELQHAKKICDEAFEAIAVNDERSFEMSVNSLEAVAKARFVLTLVANYLYKCFIQKDPGFSAQRELLLLLESARRLCVESSSSTPRLYLLKQLVRRCGFDCVRTLGGGKKLEWILPPEARQQEEDVIQDRFVVHGNQYRVIREGLAKAVISGNIGNITTAIMKSEVQNVRKDVLLLLALYREITLANASSNVSEVVKEKLEDFINNEGHISITAQPLARRLLENSQGGQFKKLQAFPRKSSQEHTLAEIVIHTAVALQYIGSGSLSEPLYALMMDPSTMKNSYLPTVPEDNYRQCIDVVTEVMKQENLKNRTSHVGKWYECGRCRLPYFVDRCSYPTKTMPCPTPGCGNVLGGVRHEFVGKYKDSDRKDRTKTGHDLGKPGSRSAITEPQRNLSSITCSLLRIVMHSAMVMGACRDSQATAQMITPPCKPEHVAEFLWQHMQRDLDALGRALGRSVDDAALTVHLVLQRMISLNGGQTVSVNARDIYLRTQDSRQSWETGFSSVILAPIVTNLDQNLQKALRLVMEDDRFGSDPLVRQLYEFDEQVEDLSFGVRPLSRSLWKCRQQITVEHLGNSFRQEALSAGGNQYKVLGAFLKQEHRLRSVQFLPDIVRLQRLLMDRFHRRIDRTDAEKFTIHKFLQETEAAKDEFVSLIQSFKIAWNSCRSFLGHQGRLPVPEDLCNTTMDNNCPIAMLLPSSTGMGVCSTSLTFFLVNTHNEFLGTHRSATNQESPLDHVPVTEVTMSHLIAYDPERDLLPLILAHCNYSIEVGQDTSVQYDWAALERQLIDRFLRGRLFVDYKEERFAFSGDTRKETVFASLKGKIPQESISRVIEVQIIAEFRSSLSDLCDVLSSLDIAIDFLALLGGLKERPLEWFLHEVLQLPKERGLKSPTAERHCNLSHTLALWRLMALEKAKIKTRNKQEPFEEIPDIFKETLSSSEVAQLNLVLREIDMNIFLPHLLEMILLNVKHADENIASMSFQEYLELYLEENKMEQIPGTNNISDNVKMEHLKAVWNSAVQLSDDFQRE